MQQLLEVALLGASSLFILYVHVMKLGFVPALLLWTMFYSAAGLNQGEIERDKVALQLVEREKESHAITVNDFGLCAAEDFVVGEGRYRLVERIHVIHELDDNGPLEAQVKEKSPEALRNSLQLAISDEMVFALPGASLYPGQSSAYLLDYPFFTETDLISKVLEEEFQEQISKIWENFEDADSKSVKFSSRYRYTFEKRFGKGACGEVWLAKTRDSSDKLYVLKRILSTTLRLSGIREIHFGMLLKGSQKISRFEEWFEENGELWLVFRYEGVSIQNWMYSVSNDGVSSPSEGWRAAISQHPGIIIRFMRDILEGLAESHEKGVTHRDIKPANVVLRAENNSVNAVLIDFGSAVSEKSKNKLYPSYGPTIAEETKQYSPPEVILKGIPYFEKDPNSYDLWSAGVLFLELLTANPNVFEIDPRTKAFVYQKLQNDPEEVQYAAIFLRGLIE